MGWAFRLPYALAPIASLFLVGVIQVMTAWWLSIILWEIALVWIIEIIIYREQVVEIDIWKCELANYNRERKEFDLTVHAFISARHPDSIGEIRLSLVENSIKPTNQLTQKISSEPQKIEAVYKVPEYLLKEARELQNGKYKENVDIAELCIGTTKNNYWASKPFEFPSMPNHKENWIMTVKRKINGNARKVKGNGISKKEFHSILDKASQPVRPDSKKS